MISGVNHEEPSDSIWTKQGKWVGSFKIELEYIKDIPNTQFIHIENPYNENKPACQGRDCTELYPKTGERMLSVFQNYRSTTSLYDSFKYFDNQENIRKQQAAQKEYYTYRNVDKISKKSADAAPPVFEKHEGKGKLSILAAPFQFSKMGHVLTK